MRDRSREFTPSTRRRVLETAGNCCQLCGARGDDPAVKIMVDHLIPISEGGTRSPRNARVLCRACHERKSMMESVCSGIRCGIRGDTANLWKGIVPYTSWITHKDVWETRRRYVCLPRLIEE